MKKIISFIVFLFVANVGWAQGINVAVSGGWAAGIFKDSKGNYAESTNSNYPSSLANSGYSGGHESVSLGEGYVGQLSISGTFKKYFEIGLTTNYHIHSSFGSNHGGTGYPEHGGGWEKNLTIDERSEYGRFSQFQLMPYCKINLGSDKSKYYLKLGLVYCSSSKINETRKYTETSSVTHTWATGIRDTLYAHYTNESFEYSGGASYGYCVAIGFEQRLVKNLFVTAEYSLISMKWAPTKWRQTSLTYDGVDQIYNSNYVSTNSSAANYWSCSSIGFQVGVKYIFKKKTPPPLPPQ